MGKRLATLALCLAGCKSVPKGPLPAGHAADVATQGCNLHGTMTLSKTTFPVGTPVTATFRLTSDCERNLPMLSAGDRESKYGRSEGYAVSADLGDGYGANQLIGGETFGGAVGRLAFGREHPHETQLQLEHYVEFQDPGRYEVKVVTHKIIGDESVKIAVSAWVDVTK